MDKNRKTLHGAIAVVLGGFIYGFFKGMVLEIRSIRQSRRRK